MGNAPCPVRTQCTFLAEAAEVYLIEILPHVGGTMFSFLRAILNEKPSAPKAATMQAAVQPDVVYMELLLLGEFDKPRRIRSVAYGWNDELKRSLIKSLLDRGDLVVCSPAERIGKAWTVEQLKACLSARGQSTAGKKADLVARLLAFDPHVADGEATDVLRCSAAGKARHDEWRKPIEREASTAAGKALAALAGGQVIAAQDVIADYWNRFPPIRHFAEQGRIAVLHAYDHINAPGIESILRAAPSMLQELSTEDSQRARMAAAIWYAGLPCPGASMALQGYAGKLDLDTILSIFRESWSNGSKSNCST